MPDLEVLDVVVNSLIPMGRWTEEEFNALPPEFKGEMPAPGNA
jgi:hypothetical protein